MKNKIRIAFVGVVLLVLTIGISFESKAQLDPPPPDNCIDPLDPACPIDGGLLILVAAGIGIGAKNARRKK
jgi:hypothetical protein